MSLVPSQGHNLMLHFLYAVESIFRFELFIPELHVLQNEIDLLDSIEVFIHITNGGGRLERSVAYAK